MFYFNEGFTFFTEAGQRCLYLQGIFVLLIPYSWKTPELTAAGNVSLLNHEKKYHTLR
jgi:hypothetical protein